jgi:hypothetical protein
MESNSKNNFNCSCCKNFKDDCSNCMKNCCICFCIYFNHALHNFICNIFSPLSFTLGFCNGVCNSPLSCSEEYESGKWNHNINSKCCIYVSFTIEPEDLLLIFWKNCDNFGRNVGSLVHPSKIKRYIIPEKHEMK